MNPLKEIFLHTIKIAFALAIGGCGLTACALMPDKPPESTPTPEIFIPLNPSPTPSDSSLPLTCQITDLNVYIDRAAGYCFAYPTRFTLGDQPSDLPSVVGPALDSSGEVYALLSLEVKPSDSDLSLEQQVDEYLLSFTVVDPASLVRTSITVGGEPGIMVDSVPAMLSWRLVFVSHDGRLYRLMYWPVDVPEAQADLEELYQTTIGSFAFLQSATAGMSAETPTTEPVVFKGTAFSFGPFSLVIHPDSKYSPIGGGVHHVN